MTQQEESANFFRLIRILIDEGSDVLRDVLLKIIHPNTLTIFVQNNIHIINTLKQRKLLFQDQYDLLTKLPAVQPEELDITLLCLIFRNLCNISPTNGWQTPPGANDLGLGDDIYRLKTIRNAIYAHTTTTRVTAADFQTLWPELKDLISRLSKHGTPKKQQGISTRITAIRFQDIDPESTTKTSVEILLKWKKQDDEKWDIISKRLKKHDDQLTKQEERFKNQGEQLDKQDKQLKKQGEQFKFEGAELRKELETHEHQLIKHEKHLKDHQEDLKQHRGHLLRQDERIRTIAHMVTDINDEQQGRGSSSLGEDKYLSDEQKFILKSWQDDDKVFVETKASNCVYNEILKRPFLTVVGNSGSGKTATARHCALKLKALGYSIVPITKLTDILTSPLKPNLKQVHILDDPIGTDGLDTIKLARAESCNDQIIRLLQTSNRKVLLTCRTQIVQDPVFQASGSFIKTHTVVLHETTLQLTEVEMSAILSKHIENENLKTSETRNINFTEIQCFNFPLLCKLYACNKQYRERGKNFFQYPFPVIVDEIEKLKHRDRLKYYALALCLLQDNQLESQVFDVFSTATADETKIRQLMEACGLLRTTPLKDVETAMQSLVGVYLIKVGAVYSFIHDTLFEATAYSFGKDYPLEVLKHCTSSFIREHVRLSSTTEDHFIILNAKYYHELCQRLIKDIEDGNFHDVFMSQLIKHNEFQIYFSEHLSSLADEKFTELFFETNVNLDKFLSYQTDNSVNSGSINRIRSLFLSEPRVKCIHFLLALGLSSFSKICLQKLDFSVLQTEALCLLPVACLGGNVEVVNVLTDDKFKCDFNEVWLGEMPTLHMAAFSGNTSMMELVIKQAVFLNSVSPEKMELILQYKAIVDSCNKDGDSPLHIAAAVGHKNIVGLLLKYLANVDLCGKDGESPLFSAAQKGHKDIVELLLQYKANVNLCNKNDVSPLYIAAQKGHKDIVKLLLNNMANVDLCEKDGESPLFSAAQEGHEDVVELLLQYKSNVDLCDINGFSPLFVAAQNGYEDMVKVLLKYQADIDLCYKCGVPPLYGAAQNGHKDIVELLLKNEAKVDFCDQDGISPLSVAIQNGHKDIVELLLQGKANIDLCDKDGVSPLFVAAQNGHDDILELLLHNKANVDLCHKKGVSPLYIAAQNGHKDAVELLLQYKATVDLCHKDGYSSLFIAAQEGRKQIVELLLKYKANVDLCHKDGFSPLCIAAQNGHKDVVELLLQYRATVDLCHKHGVSPLYIAAQEGHNDIAEMLLRYKANVDLCNEDGVSPMYIAAQNGHKDIVELLLQNKANVDLCNKDGFPPLSVAALVGHTDIVEMLLQYNADVDLCPKHGYSPLNMAAETDHRDIVELLLMNKANVDLCDIDGETPMYVATEKGHKGIAELLLKHKANVDLCDKNGSSPLYVAAENGHKDIVELLIKFKAGVDLCNKNGISPLHVAAQNGHTDIVELLLQYKANVK